MPRHKITPIEIINIASNAVRWRILMALASPGTAQEISAQVGESVHNISWHCKTLMKHGLVKARKDPKMPIRLIYSRTGFLAEIVVDYEQPGTEATFIPKVKRDG